MKRLIAFISILLLVSMAAGTAVQVTIYGTNKSNAQTNVTCYGCNNTISVQAWNTSYVKNISVNTVNASGDVVSFNISNVTAFQVQELKVNKTAVNAYQAGANGMLNFSYTVVGNKTLLLSPAINSNGYNMTWAKVWTGYERTNQTGVKALNTVYQNGAHRRMVIVSYNMDNVATNYIQIQSGTTNPPTNILTHIGSTAAVTSYGSHSAIIGINEYYQVKAVINSGGVNIWQEWDI